MPKHSRAHVTAQEPRLIELYRAGAPFAEIAAELGLTEKGVEFRVARLVREGKLERRPVIKRGPYAKPEGQAEQVIELYAQGATWAQIGEALGISHETARTRLHAAGLRPGRVTPRWEATQHWPWPLSLEEVALRLYGEHDAPARRRAGTLVHNWIAAGRLVRVGWARYGLKPEGQEEGA